MPDASRELGRSPKTKEVEMRIVETAAAGMVAIASQILIVATVLL